MITVVIGGDLCPIGKNQPYFVAGDAESIFNDLLQEFEDADLSVANLECPIIQESSPIAKNGPVLGVESDCINGLIQSKIKVLNLANNHIMDHGMTGLLNTLTVCEEAGIATVGAGRNIKEARRIFIKEIDNFRIGILGVAEHEFSIAKENCGGANPLDLIDYVRNVKNRSGNINYLIVLLHGGNEHYPLPSPRLRDICHFMVEMGANAVIAQHSHCPGCYEQYNGSTIVYGQGDLIFDWFSGHDVSPSKGFLVKLIINNYDEHSAEIVPYVQHPKGIGAKKMYGEEKEVFLREINERSARLADPAFIKEEWLKLCEERKQSYYFNLLPRFINNRVLQKVNNYFHFVEQLFSARHLLRLENMIRCESHREIIETILEKRK